MVNVDEHNQIQTFLSLDQALTLVLATSKPHFQVSLTRLQSPVFTLPRHRVETKINEVS